MQRPADIRRRRTRTAGHCDAHHRSGGDGRHRREGTSRPCAAGSPHRSVVVVAPDEMRQFALDCLRWAELTDNPSHRDLMLSVAKTWMNTASAIERRVADGAALAS